jgi:translation initiation factor 4A
MHSGGRTNRNSVSSLSPENEFSVNKKSTSALQCNQDLEECKDFEDMNLKMDLLRGIYAYGWEKPSPIQSLAITPMIQGNDLLAQAQSGTGKTGAFTTASLQLINPELGRPQVLQLSPTRELAHQTFEVAQTLARWIPNVKVLKVVGGRSRGKDIQGLHEGAQFIVGTPGRVLDLIDRSPDAFPTNYLKVLCLDEADEMLSKGFREAMYDIFQFMPQDIQICLFSATMPREVKEMTNKFMRDPVKILVKAGQLTLDGIAQYYLHCEHNGNKFEYLCALYDDMSISQAVIFVNSRTRCENLWHDLTQKDFTVSMIHGGMDSDERNLRMKQFKSGSTRIMISTDLLARGIDCQEVSVVINYDLPFNSENYIHRIGRSGRFGKKGVAINFATSRDEYIVHDLQRFYATTIEELPRDLATVFDI